jgi:hemin uptake protein HemP
MRDPTCQAPPSPAAAPPAASAAAEGAPMRRIDSRDLLGAAHEVEIDHGGHIYRLRRTSLGKLILTK